MGEKEFGIEDGEDDLDAAVEVAGHEVGAAQIDEGIPVVVEDKDAAVFKKAVDNAADADGFAESGDAGAEAADAADDHVDGDAFLGGGVCHFLRRLRGSGGAGGGDFANGVYGDPGLEPIWGIGLSGFRCWQENLKLSKMADGRSEMGVV